MIFKRTFIIVLTSVTGGRKFITPALSVQATRRLESLIEMRVAEENRLSSGITVDPVRASEHLRVHKFC
ncbi:MAG: hypothetical protein WCF57_17970 [Pyrinomonadaceae bacterium]